MSSESPVWHQEAQDDQSRSPIVHTRVHDFVVDAAFPIPVDDQFPSTNKLFDEGLQSDFFVIAQGHTHEVHKSVLGHTSKYFERIFYEGRDRSANLTAEDSEILHACLECMYKDKLPGDELKNTIFDPEKLVKLSIIADRLETKDTKILNKSSIFT